MKLDYIDDTLDAKEAIRASLDKLDSEVLARILSITSGNDTVVADQVCVGECCGQALWENGYSKVYRNGEAVGDYDYEKKEIAK